MAPNRETPFCKKNIDELNEMSLSIAKLSSSEIAKCRDSDSKYFIYRMKKQ
jgi:hypothetical protein